LTGTEPPHVGTPVPWLIVGCCWVQLEGRFDQGDELRAGCWEPPIDLADGVGDGEIGQVHGHQLDWLGDELAVELGGLVHSKLITFGFTRRLPRSWPVPRGASVEERLSEAASRRAESDWDSASRRGAEGSQGKASLFVPRSGRGLYLDGSVSADTCPGVG
jgi:hypothetical protein